MGVDGQRHACATLPPGETEYPLLEEAGWATGLVWMGVENLTPNRDSIHGTSSPYQVAILTELSQPSVRWLFRRQVLVKIFELHG